MALAPLPRSCREHGAGAVTVGLLAGQAMVLAFGTGGAMWAAVTGESVRPIRSILRNFGVAREGLQPGNLFASLFLHAGPASGFLAAGLHLLLLGVLGSDVERRISRVHFLALYVLGGAAGALVGSLLSFVDAPSPTLASTSALAAVMGAHFALLHGRHFRVGFLALGSYHRMRLPPPLPHPSVPKYLGTWTLPSRATLPLFLVLAAVASISMEARSAFLPGAAIGLLVGTTTATRASG